MRDVFEAVKSCPGGISVRELSDQFPNLAQRTIQRRLKELRDQGRVRLEGRGPSSRYIAVERATGFRESATSDSKIPLSEDSVEVLAYVSRPVERRHPVGYQREFLADYRPNQTYYLSAPLRRHLRRIGDTGQTRLPAGTYGREILQRLMVDLSWASSHLEGNTYSLLDTQRLIAHGQRADGKDALETQMILNHKAVIELIAENQEAVALNRLTLLSLHAVLSENLMKNASDEGRLRQFPVEIGKSVFRPLGDPWQLNECFDLLLERACQIEDPFEQSFFMMVHLPYLQPFMDVNKRTSRLAANIPLLRANLCPLTFLGVSARDYALATLGVYEMTRVELLRDLYVWAYERSTREYLAIKSEAVEPDPLRLAWRNVIHEVVRAVVLNPNVPSLAMIRATLEEHQVGADYEAVEALAMEELRRLHEGVIARYRLKVSDYQRWRARTNRRA